MLNITPITPPRVPLIDPRTGLIERSWYMFFLSLFTTAQGMEDPLLVPNTAALLASYDEALRLLSNDVRTLPVQPEYTQSEYAAPSLQQYLPPDEVTPPVQQYAQPDDVTPARQEVVQQDILTPAVESPMPDNNGTVASATALDLTQITSSFIDVTGTTTITSIIIPEGQTRTVRFTGALTLTNGASLALPGAANITTVAGDYAEFRGYAAGVIRCVVYTYVSGLSAVLAATIHAATSKTTPVDADEMPLADSATSFGLKKLTWANLKATLATWLNSTLIPASFTTLSSTASGSAVSLSVQGASGYGTNVALRTFAANGAAYHTLTEGGTPAQVSWRYGSNIIANGRFEIIPSTAVGGSTFTTPALHITATYVTVGTGATLVVQGGTSLLKTNAALTNGAGAGAGTLLNAPAAGNPTKWIPINDGGTTRYIPTW